jgi:hypothetical protein
MRTSAALAIAFLTACGGAQKPEASSADTSSLEQQHESAGGASSDTAPAGDDSSSKSSASASTPTAAPTASAAPDSTPAPPAGGVHPTPSAMGSIDGKPFTPKIARATAAMHKDGRLLVTLTEGTEGTECGATPKAGEGTLSLLLEWKDGYKTDIGSLRRATKPGGGEVGFSRGASVSRTFKPTGRVTVVSAPTDANATGKLKLDVQSGDFMLAGDLDVLLCVAAK